MLLAEPGSGGYGSSGAGAVDVIRRTPFAALEFFSINDNAVIMYDAPSLKADKLYVASRNLPVEAVVKVEGWVKVRDSGEPLPGWKKKTLSDKRYVIVTLLRRSLSGRKYEFAPGIPGTAKRVIGTAGAAANGWVRVRHRDGQIGYVRTNQVWGS